jgi:hypothetical protein
MSNKSKLKALKEAYGVTHFIISDLSGYSLYTINGLFSSKPVGKRALKTIEAALIAKYGKKTR